MNCQRCYRAMRPMKSLQEDHPGTIRQAIPGLCASCYKRGGKHKPKTARDDAAIAGTRATLAAYLAWRRPYRLKAGIP